MGISWPTNLPVPTGTRDNQVRPPIPNIPDFCVPSLSSHSCSSHPLNHPLFPFLHPSLAMMSSTLPTVYSIFQPMALLSLPEAFCHQRITPLSVPQEAWWHEGHHWHAAIRDYKPTALPAFLEAYTYEVLPSLPTPGTIRWLKASIRTTKEEYTKKISQF